MTDTPANEHQIVDVLKSVATSLGADARVLYRAAEELTNPNTITVAEAVLQVLDTLRGGTQDRYRRALAKLVDRCGDRPLAEISIIQLRTWDCRALR